MKLTLGFLLVMTSVAFSQSSSVLPSNRMVDWENAGIRNDKRIDLSYSHRLMVTDFGAVGDGQTNDTQAVLKALEKAKELIGRVQIYFPPGEYLLTKTINIHGQSNLSITGAGPNTGPGALPYGTTLVFDDSMGDFSNDSDNITSLIRVSGWISSDIGPLTGYDRNFNTIKVNGSTNRLIPGQLLLIHPIAIKKNKFLGQMTNIHQVTDGEITLTDDFTLTWEDRNDTDFMITLINGVSNIIIENLSILRRGMYSLDHNETPGVNIHFKYATESIVRNVHSHNPVSIHINSQFSSHLEIINNYFDGAQNHDGFGGGQGYGVDLSNFTTYSLVENNIFRRLRHSLVVSRGANRNVFGYNYSREVTFTSGTNVADLSIHGYYPYANLFEGNYVDRIWADDYHSANGPINTLLRNFVKSKDILIESSNRFNIIGNDGFIYKIKNSEEIVDHLGTTSTQVENRITIQKYTHNGNSDGLNQHLLKDISYYHRHKPTFFSRAISWPALGPPTTKLKIPSQTIPALLRYCETYPQDCS
ncbi:MAG: glycosyl hydrolase family 28-related protein [Balneolales bacterium]